jgi:hypothetical protein
MMDMYQKLSKTLDAMNESQAAKYWKARKQGSSAEVQLNLAETILGKQVAESRREELRESFKGKRNNGPQVLTEADKKVQAVQEADTKLFKALGIPVKDKLPKVIQEAGPQVVADYEFCRRLPMSEADAVKCATENLLRDSSRAVSRRRELIKD